MDYILLILAIGLIVLAIAGGWTLTLLGLPGNWLMVAATALYSWLTPSTRITHISWTTVLVLLLFAVLGELAEFAASMWGARRVGGSRRAAVFSLLGSLLGALVGGTLGVPLFPVLGPPVAAVLGGAVGAMIGASFAEHTRGETSGQSLRVGKAAFVGRLLGTGVKTLVATVMALVALGSLIL